LSSEKGDLAEVMFDTKIIEMGFVVSRPVNSQSTYDRIVDSGNIHRVQIKSIWHEKRLNSEYKIYLRKKRNQKYEPGDVDIFAVYIHSLKSWYIIPYSEMKVCIYPKQTYLERWDKFN
jgi:hypothetical protein